MKRFFAATTAALMVSLVASVAIAAPTPTTDVMGQSWRVYNVKPATSSFWDINKVKLLDGELVIPIQKFESTTTGSFAVYLRNNYNVDMTGATLTADLSWTAGPYATRGPGSGAYVRFEFQNVTSGAITSSSYWWSSVRLDLNTVTEGQLIADLGDRNLWTNICGQSATDEIAHPGANCVGGTDPAVSPFDGFTNALKNVKQLGLSFGSDSRFASGVALVAGPGEFTVETFTVTP